MSLLTLLRMMKRASFRFEKRITPPSILFSIFIRASSLWSEKVRCNIDNFQGFIGKFGLISNRVKLYSPPFQFDYLKLFTRPPRPTGAFGAAGSNVIARAALVANVTLIVLSGLEMSKCSHIWLVGGMMSKCCHMVSGWNDEQMLP